MNIFVTGATGVFGKATVPQLVAAGHQVFALRRSQANVELLKRLGAQAVTANLFKSEELAQVFEAHQIEAVLHLATKIPPTSRLGKLSSWQKNDHIRRYGTRALVDAAMATHVQTIVYPSYYYVYPDQGEQWIDAQSTPLPSQPAQVAQSTLDAEAELARFTEAGRRGVVLRMSSVYGPHASSSQEQLAMARKGFVALPGRGDAYISSIWVDDAASALVTALNGVPAGIYDISDDEPLTHAEFVAALAQAVGKKHLWSMPGWLMNLLASAVADVASRSLRISNRHFRELTAWQPAVPNAYEGWRLIAQAEVLSRPKQRAQRRCSMPEKRTQQPRRQPIPLARFRSQWQVVLQE
jgi:nucleoside-diphosphate-sugar epimerase